MKTIYLDNNATTRTDDEVLDAMRPYFSDLYGNPSSMHAFGGQVAHAVARAREQVAALIHCSPSEIFFTSCGTESDNTAIHSTLEAYPERRHIVTTRVEHPAVRVTCRHFQSRHGYRLSELPVDSQGRLSLDLLEQTVDDDTAIVSIMHANNETGVVFPIERIAQIVKSHGGVFHTDAVQTAGKIPIDLRRTPIDLMSISGHKIHAPKGIGVLYVRHGTHLPPFIMGGHQEQGKRAGTENVPHIVGLGKACELALRHLDEENTRVRALRDRLREGLMARCMDPYINGDPDSCLPNTLNISFEFVEGEAILLHMDAFGIAASSGSACTSGALEPSHVLRAMGVPFTRAHGSIRFSLSRYTTQDEIDYVIEKTPPIIEKLRRMSPFGRKPEMSTKT
ncbi:cysteine desulfurase NifS [Candidatus Sumerlaeota bacterium]|nr:cysteine desulfurase NifS [Candidatus Sumerlaeota bacterium]